MSPQLLLFFSDLLSVFLIFKFSLFIFCRRIFTHRNKCFKTRQQCLMAMVTIVLFFRILHLFYLYVFPFCNANVGGYLHMEINTLKVAQTVSLMVVCWESVTLWWRDGNLFFFFCGIGQLELSLSQWKVWPCKLSFRFLFFFSSDFEADNGFSWM